MVLSAVSNAFDMSIIIKYTVRFCDVMDFSTRSLVAKTCSVVLRQTAWQGAVSELISGIIRFLIQITNIFWRIDSRVIGWEFSTVPFGFPGFWMTFVILFTISFELFLVPVISLKIAAICFTSFSVPNFRSSALIASLPTFLFFLVS